MTDLQLFAITTAGPQPLPTPATATDFTDLYHGLALGVYSVIRTYDHNKFLRLEHHLARTAKSMRLLGWEYQLDESRLRQAIHTLSTAYPTSEMRVRIDVLAEPAYSLGTESRELLALMPFTPLPSTYYTQGVTVDFAADLHRANPLIKTADFAEARKRSGQPSAAYELLLVENGKILEGASSNFYGVQNGILYTAGVGVLEGITRSVILDLARQLPMPVQLDPIRVDEIGQLTEAAISSSSRGLLPVVQVGETIIGNGQPGPYTQRLMAAYDAFVAQNVRMAIE